MEGKNPFDSSKSAPDGVAYDSPVQHNDKQPPSDNGQR